MQFSCAQLLDFHILISKPTSNVAPKSSSEKYGNIFLLGAIQKDVIMTCEVSGYPAPIFRSVTGSKGSPHQGMLQFFLLFSEPTGSVAPRVSSKTIDIKVVRSGASAVALCPAQSFPVPSFRWYKFIEGTNRKQAVILNDRVKQVAGTLIIREAKVEDSGKYLCVVNNSVGGESVETVLTVTAPLKAKIDPPVQTIDFGRPAVFTCKFEGNPIKTISWLKDGNPIDHTDAIMRIEAVRKEDKGMYQCFIRNDQESAEATAELKLGGRFEPPQIRHAFNEETVQPGNSVFMKCIASGNPTPEITWELYGRRLANSDVYQIGQYVTVNGDVVSHLNISAIHTNDGGLYRCIASSKVGSADHSARINVYGLPFVRSMEKQAIVAGGTLIVHCPFAGHPVETVVWERDGRSLPINRKQKVFQNGTLIIENVERTSDQATYDCVAKNAQGYSARGSLEVQVMVAPIISPFQFDGPLNAGDNAILPCYVQQGDLPLKIKWFHNGHHINHHSKGISTSVFGSQASILNINSVEKHHRGEYACVVTNAAGKSRFIARLDVNVPPQIHPFDFGDESVDSGDMAIVNCAAIKGDLPISISWTLNGKPVSAIDGISVVKTKPRVSQLTIDDVQAQHSGEYECIARNMAANASFTTNLHVNVPPQIHPFDFGEEAVNSGELVVAMCAISKGDYPIKLSWLLNGQNINNFDGIQSANTNKRVSQLTIESVQSHHSGEYTCFVQNTAGSAKHSAYLNVNVAPQIAPFDFGDESINSGDSTSASCSIHKGDLPINISWLHNNISMGYMDGILITKAGKKASMITIESVRGKHSGVYTCVAENRAGSARFSAWLNVNVLPQIAPFDFGEESINEGDSTSASCSIHKGDLPINISWLHNNISVGYIDGVVVTKVGKKLSTITIDSVQDKHSGRYTCVAENKAGQVRFSTRLDVNVAPQIAPFDFGDEPVNSGDSTSASCSIHKGDLPMNISWLHNNISLGYMEGVVVTKVGKKASMITIESVQEKHSGVYTCIAENKAGSTGYSAKLDVNVDPQITPFGFGEESINEGDSTSASCSIHKGDLPINISWLHNNISVGYMDGVIVTKVGKKISTISMDSVQDKHSGWYTCVAENKAGQVRFSTRLDVNGLGKEAKSSCSDTLFGIFFKTVLSVQLFLSDDDAEGDNLTALERILQFVQRAEPQNKQATFCKIILITFELSKSSFFNEVHPR
ncbi:hypothetical protein JTB14_005123 [Gonioctena quinquepunctata]|nr:hypothetical protein JTB14_005123 [Gonioctena quinquepunctata]